MKGFSFAALLVMLVVLVSAFSFGVNAEENVVVYTGDRFASLADAFNAVADGGTVVLAETYEISLTEALALPAKRATLTSIHGATDYQKSGVFLGLGKALSLGADLTLENVTVRQTSDNKSAWGAIYANGHHLTVGEGVTTVANASSKLAPSIFGGSSEACSFESTHITIKSGSWYYVLGGGYTDTTANTNVELAGGEVYNVYGGSYAGTFTGNTSVHLTGGVSSNLLNGGSRSGTVNGNCLADLEGGEAAIVCGGVYGAEKTTVNGNVTLRIHGDAVVNKSVHGASYNTNVTFNGNVLIDIYGNAHLKRHLYGGSYTGVCHLGDEGIRVLIRENAKFTKPSDNNSVVCGASFSGAVYGNVSLEVSDNAYIPGNVFAAGYKGTLNGNSTAVINGGEVTISFTAGTRGGAVNGNTYVYANGGRTGYYSASSVYGIIGSGAQVNETVFGTINGKATIVLNGADVAGAISNGLAKDYEIILKAGKFGSVTGTADVDLSDGGVLSVGGNLSVRKLTGGGTLSLNASSKITADELSGSVGVMITSGAPVHNQVYLTVKNAGNGTVKYLGGAGSLVAEQRAGETDFVLSIAGILDDVKVSVFYYNPKGKNEIQPNIVIYKGVNSTAEYKTKQNVEISVVDGKNCATFKATPGLHFAKIYYGNGSADYFVKYFYVSGTVAELTYDCPFEPYVENAYMETRYTYLTDEVMEYFAVSNLKNYKKPQTPTFTNEEIFNRRAFLTNAEVCEYVDYLAGKSPYCYAFYPHDLSPMGNRSPVLVFTKDKIPAGASFEETAAIVRGGGVREILMITGGVHGNEPTGVEGTLSFAYELTEDYGKQVLDKFGAIVIMPVVSPDNTQRFMRLTADGINPARHMLANTINSTQSYIKTYTTFMPTICIECHEDTGSLLPDASDYSIEQLDDVNIKFVEIKNSPLLNPADYVGGMAADEYINTVSAKIALNAIAATRERTNLRASFYPQVMCNPGVCKDYPQIRGSYSFLIECMRIWSGKVRFERSVFAMTEALKSLTNEMISYQGQLARDVFENRARVAAITDFDENRLFSLRTVPSGAAKVSMPRPSIYVDGTYKNKDGVKYYNLIDTVTNTRALPTAYVISADDKDIDAILRVLDSHRIGYTKIANGSTLTLRKYGGIYSGVTIGEAAEVTFQNGAYAVTLNTSDAYLIAYLFEPDCYPYSNPEETTLSLAHMGYITDGDAFYRSEVNGVAEIIRLLDVNYDPNAPVTEPVTGSAGGNDARPGTGEVDPPANSDSFKYLVVVCVTVVVIVALVLTFLLLMKKKGK